MTLENTNTNTKLLVDSGYARSPKQAKRYRWWKPIPIAILAFFLWMVLFGVLAGILSVEANLSVEDVLNLASDGYDDADFISVPGILMNIGTLGLIIPALFIATKIFRLPFGLATSVYGKMRWKLLFRCFLLSLVFYGVMTFGIPPFMDFSEFGGIEIRSLIALLIVVPLQCAAEEYLFRGFIMQTIGSWLPWRVVGTVIAVLLQTAIFTSQHPYNLAGKASVAVTALVFAYLAIRTGGLEAGIAAHSVNNLIAFITAAVQVSEVTSEIDWISTATGAVIEIAFAVAIVKIGGRYGWFADFEKERAEAEKAKAEQEALEAAMAEIEAQAAEAAEAAQNDGAAYGATGSDEIGLTEEERKAIAEHAYDVETVPDEYLDWKRPNEN